MNIFRRLSFWRTDDMDSLFGHLPVEGVEFDHLTPPNRLRAIYAAQLQILGELRELRRTTVSDAAMAEFQATTDRIKARADEGQAAFDKVGRPV
jgi:hypothetical protein